jgi:N-acetylneuraminic acid mutarotase
MKQILALLFLLPVSKGILYAQNWTKLNSVGINNSAPFISYRGAAATFYLNGKVYWGTGENPSNYYNDWWEIDPVTKVFTQMASIPADPRSGAIAFTIGNKGYVGTGEKYMKLYKDFFEYDPVANSWTEKSKVPVEKRSYGVGFSIGGYGYVGTGGADILGDLDDLRQYDPATDKWEEKASLPGPDRRNAAGFALNGIGYIGTGYTSTGLVEDFWAYNPESNSWTQKADFGGGPVELATGFALNNNGYILASETNELWKYDPDDNTWHKKSKYPGLALDARAVATWGDTALVSGISKYLGVNCNEFFSYDDNTNRWSAFFKDGSGLANRAGAIGFGINDKCYVGTGYPTATTGSFSDLFELDLNTNNWSQKIDLPEIGRRAAVAFTIGGKGYVGTGDKQFSDESFNDFWEFDPATGSWTQKANFGGSKRGYAVGFATPTKGYIGLGMNEGVLKSDFWEYDPINNSWSNIADYPGGLRQNAASFQIDNKGYVGTGTDASGNKKKDFYCYNSDSQLWTQIADFGGGFRSNAIGFATEGKGYAGLGISSTGKVTKDIWAYNASLNSWNQMPDFPGIARHSAVAFALNGRGYVGTGVDSLGKYLADFWEYKICSADSISILTSGPTTFCTSEKVTLTAIGPGILNYQWNKNGILISDATHQSYTATKTGDYSCSIVNSCGNVMSDTVIVIEFLRPKAKIKNESPVNICEGDEVKLKAKTGEGYSYQWVFNDVDIPGATAENYTASEPGFYTLYVTDINGCSKTSPPLVLNVTCKESSALLSSINLYPNPAHDKLYISFTGNMTQMNVSIFNILGEIVLNTKINGWESPAFIDIRSLIQGFYFISLNNGQEVQNFRFEIN